MSRARPDGRSASSSAASPTRSFTPRWTAKAAGGDASSTGHAIEGGGPFGALGASAVVGAGDRDQDALIGGVGRGVYVVDFWYTRILDPRTQV